MQTRPSLVRKPGFFRRHKLATVLTLAFAGAVAWSFWPQDDDIQIPDVSIMADEPADSLQPEAGADELSKIAGMPVALFRSRSLEGASGQFNIIAGPGALFFTEEKNPNQWLEKLAQKYPASAWVLENAQGQRACAINDESSDFATRTLDRLTGAYACAAPEGMVRAAGTDKMPIWPKAFLQAMDKARQSYGLTDAQIESYISGPGAVYLETYYLDITGYDRSQHCDAVYSALDKRSDKIIDKMAALVLAHDAAQTDAYFKEIGARRNFDTLYLILALRALGDNAADLGLKDGEIIRGFITQKTDLPACPVAPAMK